MCILCPVDYTVFVCVFVPLYSEQVKDIIAEREEVGTAVDFLHSTSEYLTS